MVVDRLYSLLVAGAQASTQSSSPTTRSQQGDPDQAESPLSNKTLADIATQLDYSAEGLPRDHRQQLAQQPKKIDLAALFMTGKTAARAPEQVNQVDKTTPQPVSELRSFEISSKLETRANEQDSEPSLLHSSNNSYDGSVAGVTGNTLHSEEDDTISAKKLKETSQEIVETRKESHANPISRVEEEPVKLNQCTESTLSLDQFQHINPFERLKRVPRRYVKIHKDQNSLLERKDCWYEPHGSQIRLAALPTGVLDNLTDFVKRKSDGSQNQGQEPESSSPESEEHTQKDYTVNEKSRSNTADPDVDSVNDDGKVMTRINHIGSRHFSSSGPTVKDAAEEVYGETEDDDDGCTSWEPSPEPEGNSYEPVNPQTSRSDNLLRPQQESSVESLQSLRSRPKPFTRVPVTIPPSSPTREEDLEIVVPHAIGDVIEVDYKVSEMRPMNSQDLPSAASQSSCFVQVKQTPFPKSRGPNHSSFGRSVTAKFPTPRDVSSDPVIPATFNDTSISGAYFSASHHQRSDNQGGDATSPPQSEGHSVRDESYGILAGPQGMESTKDSPSPPSSTSISAPPGSSKASNSEENPPSSQQIPASPPCARAATRTKRPALSSNTARNISNLIEPDRGRLAAPATSISRRERKLFDKFTGFNGNSASGRKQKHEIMMDALEKIRVARLQMKRGISGFAIGMERPKQVISAFAADESKLSRGRCSMSTSPNPHAEIEKGLRVEPNTPGDPYTSSSTSDSSMPPDGYDDETAPRKADEQQLLNSSRRCSQPKEVMDVGITQSDKATFSIYNRFVSLYPAYAGDEKCFVRALVYMEWMKDMGNGLHPFLCDDFVRVFPEYETITRKLPPLQRVTGRNYYDKNVKRPLFQHGLITPDNLAVNLSTLNPSYVQLVRNKYRAPAPPQAEPMLVVSPITIQAEQTEAEDFMITTLSQSKGLQREGSPELGSQDRFARKPFFETASQSHNSIDEPGVLVASSRLDSGRCGKICENIKTTKRTLPWVSNGHVQILSAQRQSSPQRSGPPARTELGSESAGSKKRRLATDQTRRATLPPGLRASSSRSLPHSSWIERPARSESRVSEVFEASATKTSKRAFKAARLSPKLHCYTDRLVTEPPVVEALRTTEVRKHPRKITVDKPAAACRQSGGGSLNAAKPKGQKKSSFSDFVSQRVGSGMFSKASSIPGSTPGTNFCTKRKDATGYPVAFMEPETLAKQG
ncbi:hypothetical protein JHW43_006777 [Diplocarpon mali]|nr:hypothetical protein JHW43_006777 [Diplocarpon mali]